MVLYVIQLDIHPQKAEAYAEHVRQEIPRMLAAGGFREMRGYRGAAGAS
jgi:hypothetical protein